MIWYSALIAVLLGERAAELMVSARNSRWSLAHGGVEHAHGQVLPMVLLHAGLLAGCLAEAWFAARSFLPWLGWPMLALVVLANALRWWCILTLGRQWSTRVIVVPGMSAVRAGPYRWFRHPNYVAVAVEGAALPLVYTGSITAIAFTALNAVLLLGFRVPAENRALRELGASSPARPRQRVDGQGRNE